MTADRFPPTPGLAETAARVGRAYDAAENRDVATRARKRMEAAAPDMLAALKLALPFIPNDAMTYSKGTYGDRVYIADTIRAAIAKAEGAA